MMGLSHAAVADDGLRSALIVGLRPSSPAGSLAAATPGTGPRPAVSRTPMRCRAGTGRWGQ